jgi:uncharacterized protein (TIGR02453 family)
MSGPSRATESPPEGFAPQVFSWFEGLERDNSRGYFQRTRALFEREVRGGLEGLLDALSETFGPGVKVFRQHRDLRFTPDKSPYKTRTYGIVGARYYAELSARGLYAGTGYHVMTSAQLERYRAAVADEAAGAALLAALPEQLEVEGAALKTAPRGYPRDHPRIRLLRHKALIAGRRLAPGGDGIPGDAARAHCAGVWRAAAPMNAWLDEHVGT